MGMVVAVHGPHTWGQPFFAESDYIYVNMLGPFDLEFKSKNVSNAIPGDAYEWDFGDGTQVVNGFEVRHLFPQPGVFTVTLTIDTTSGPITDQIEIHLDGNGLRAEPEEEEEEPEAA